MDPLVALALPKIVLKNGRPMSLPKPDVVGHRILICAEKECRRVFDGLGLAVALQSTNHVAELQQTGADVGGSVHGGFATLP